MLVNNRLSLGANMTKEWKFHHALPDQTRFLSVYDMMYMAAVQKRKSNVFHKRPYLRLMF